MDGYQNFYIISSDSHLWIVNIPVLVRSRIPDALSIISMSSSMETKVHIWYSHGTWQYVIMYKAYTFRMLSQSVNVCVFLTANGRIIIGVTFVIFPLNVPLLLPNLNSNTEIWGKSTNLPYVLICCPYQSKVCDLKDSRNGFTYHLYVVKTQDYWTII